MDSKKLKAAGVRILITLAMTVITLICVSAFSCQLSPEGITILGGTYDCPKLTGFFIEGKNRLKVLFSKRVSLTELRIVPADATQEQFADESMLPSGTEINETEDGFWQYDMTFDETFECGNAYVLYGVVEDSRGNSLSFSSGFSGYNDDLPEIVLSEVRTEYSKPKLEFVELYVLKDGNLGGMELEVYYGTKKNTFIFPAVRVHEGEYIVLHMRTVEQTEDELESISSCTAADACPAARDMWFPSETKAIGKTGVILLRERENGALTDALLYAESGKSYWPNDGMKAAAQSAFLAGIWKEGAETDQAVCSDKCTTTRTLSRQNYEEEGAASWIVVATSSATPGARNSEKPAD